MAKLYAELTSDKGGRKVSKGGNAYIRLELKRGNKVTHTIVYDELGIQVEDLRSGDTLLNQSDS